MLDSLRQKVEGLAQEGRTLLKKLNGLRSGGYSYKTLDLARTSTENYYAWHTAAGVLVRANLPEAEEEFKARHAAARHNLNAVVDPSGDADERCLLSLEQAVAVQLGILRSIPDAIEGKALGIRGLLARDLMDGELNAAQHLLDNGYVREAGVIAGVALEGHLKLLCEGRSIEVGTRDTVGALNEKLRRHYADDSEYRRVQWMSEVRASCVHHRDTPPETNKVEQLISAVRNFIAAIR